MSSTLMDLDRPTGASSNGQSLNIQRSLGGTASVSNLSDVMPSFRPTKVRGMMYCCSILAARTEPSDIMHRLLT